MVGGGGGGKVRSSSRWEIFLGEEVKVKARTKERLGKPTAVTPRVGYYRWSQPVNRKMSDLTTRIGINSRHQREYCQM